jgi:methionyl-tRNA formyltransferase
MTERIRPTDTAGDLLDRLAEAGAGLLVATLDGIESGELVAKPQSPDGVSLAPKIDVADARIEWAAPARAVDRLVRGCTPAPGAWTTFRGERLKVGPVVVASPEEVPGHGTLRPGELLVTKQAVHVGTATMPVRLGTVQAHGKKAMAAPDWARGTRIERGEVLDDD